MTKQLSRNWVEWALFNNDGSLPHWATINTLLLEVKQQLYIETAPDKLISLWRHESRTLNSCMKG